MELEKSIEKFINLMRVKHFSLRTERCYSHWLARYCKFIQLSKTNNSSEEKFQSFLTHLARQGMSASGQNQAFNAIILFYREVLGTELKKVNALRANRPEHHRHAPSVVETMNLLREIQSSTSFAVSLASRLLYGCGLRVSEPLELRIKDIDFNAGQLIIRNAKGAKDRVVAIPCSIIQDLKVQKDSAEAIWKRDSHLKIPVKLPGLLAVKYPAFRFAWQWAWLFPMNNPCKDPRTGETVRYRLLENNIQRAVSKSCHKLGLSIMPHELRHAYATHCLNRGENPRAIQMAMGHKSLETTMGYLHAEAMSVRSPIDVIVNS